MTRAEKEWEVYSGKYRTYIKTERGLAANTVEAYMRDLRRFRRFVTERYRLSPLEVETPVVEEFLNSLFEAGAEKSTQNRTLSGVSSFYDFLLRTDVLTLTAATPTALFFFAATAAAGLGGLLAYLLGGDAGRFQEDMETLRENYPPAAFYSAMNFLGTHDTPRILTLLGAEHIPAAKEERAAFALSPAQLARGRAKLRLAGMLLYGFPGSPTLFYGDEAGMQGFEDPLNRGTYPWGREDTGLLDFFRALGRLRKERRSLQSGSLTYIYAQGGGLVITREHEGETTMVALNAGDEALTLTLPWPRGTAEDGLTGQRFLAVNGQLRLSLPPLDGVVLI